MLNSADGYSLINWPNNFLDSDDVVYHIVDQ